MLQNQNHRFRKLATECLAGSAAIALITFVCFRFRLDPLIPACLYLISLILLALRGTFVPSVIVSFVAVGCLDYYFISPIFSITVSNPSTILTLITFLATLTVIARLVSGKQLLQQVWGPAYESETNYLRFYLAKLRQKLEPEPSHPRQLLTEPGMGYRFQP